MEIIERCNCGCGQPRPPKPRRGPRAIHASASCRKRAFDRKRSFNFTPQPTRQIDAARQPYSSPLERLAKAVIEARVIARIFLQLETEVDPKLAWRAGRAGSVMEEILNDHFPSN